MNFTFGIITDGNSTNKLNIIINSIEKENIPNYEIIIVGGEKIEKENIIHIPFNENIKPKWITKKKNIITENAKYENIVYMHDYVKLEEDWYKGYLKFGNNFNVCMNIIKNSDNSRFRDWTLWAADKYVQSPRFLIPYDLIHLTKLMYISGAYWIAKKYFMLENPLNENLVWGESEDVEWSLRVRNKIEFDMNPFSSVKFLKFKYKVFEFPTESDIKKLRNLKKEDII